MDSEQFHAPPTTTAALKSYFCHCGATADSTDIELVHFRDASSIGQWLKRWQVQGLAHAQQAARRQLAPVAGFSFYTWNAAEFLALARSLKELCPELLIVAGGPHVQQAEDYLGFEAVDLVVLGEGEITFQQFLDCAGPADWPQIDGLAYLAAGELTITGARQRCRELDLLPSPLEVLELTDADGQPLYESISYETSRGCPFRCAFCEWGTGAIGSKMYQWSMARIRQDWEKIAAAGIRDIWLADSNFGALKQDLDKARLIVDLKRRTGLPLSFATSWSKKHSRQVQEIALLLHRHQLLPHYQLALQTLTPEALRLSNRDNMSSNQYQPIAKRMSEQGVPIAAELIWGLPGDNLADFERNLDTLLATFPNINIFGYTLLPGTEFYRRREEYRIEAIPVAGYGKARGEYVVGCHSFSRDEGEEGYFLITAHILLIHGHVIPLLARYLALAAAVPVSPLLRRVLRDLLSAFGPTLAGFHCDDRMSIYEGRNALYLAALADLPRCYAIIEAALSQHCAAHGLDPQRPLQILSLDRALCPRTGAEHRLQVEFDFDAAAAFEALAAMELPAQDAGEPGCFVVCHPGGVGEILLDANGGSWVRGVLEAQPSPTPTSAARYVAVG
jgi:hypothetical protein